MLLRRAVNAFVAVVGLLVGLPAVVVAERLRRGWGRTVGIAVIRGVSAACGVRYEIEAGDGVSADRCVYVPNHSSPLDIPAMLLTRRDVRFAAAAEWFRIPLLGGAVRAFGSVPIDRSNPRAAQAELESFVARESQFALVVFAQGGIPVAGEPFEFKTGAFLLAIEAHASVVPVAIAGTGDVLPRGDKVLVRPGVVRVRVLDTIATDGMTKRDRKALRTTAQQAVVDTLDALDALDELA